MQFAFFSCLRGAHRKLFRYAQRIWERLAIASLTRRSALVGMQRAMRSFSASCSIGLAIQISLSLIDSIPSFAVGSQATIAIGNDPSAQCFHLLRLKPTRLLLKQFFCVWIGKVKVFAAAMFMLAETIVKLIFN
jgi:hypothetical protein